MSASRTVIEMRVIDERPAADTSRHLPDREILAELRMPAERSYALDVYQQALRAICVQPGTILIVEEGEVVR